MAEMTYLQAISDGLRQEMRRDSRVFVLGEDVGVYGGAFKVTLGFQEEFGSWRVIDTPLSETAIVGGATGAALMGLRPVAEMQFADFVSCAWDHLVTVAAKQRWRAGTPVPFVLRLPSGGGFSGGPFHSQNPESSFAHIPGLKCVCPATPEDAKGLIIAAIEDPNPVLFFEHKHLYRRIKGEVPEERYTVPIGKARIHAEGTDVSVITWGAMVYTAEEAAAQVGCVRRDRRPAQRDAVGQAGGARLRPQDVQGARAPRGHPHRRLRRRDRRDDRGGGVRGSRRAGSAHRGARLSRALLAGAREGVHPAGRGRRAGAQGARGVLGARMATGTAVDVVMPQMGVSVSEGTITRWLKQVGDHVESDETLLEISTDKVDTEVPSPASGVVSEILVPEGETVEVGTVLARIGGEATAEQAAAPPAPAEPAQPAAAEAAAPAAEPAPGAPTPEPVSAAPPSEPAVTAAPRPAEPSNGKAFISPVVARIAGEHGVDPSQVPGTGTGGRVTKKDILAFIEAGGAAAPEPEPEPSAAPAEAVAPPPAAPAVPAAPAAPPTPPPAAPAPAPAVAARAEPAAEAPGETFEPISAMRRGIAEHMRRSLDTSAHVTSAIEVDMTNVVSVRAKLKKEFEQAYGVNPTYLAFVARATVDTLRDYPYVNGELRDGQIVTRNFVNLGFAVELAEGKGLIVPVVKNAEMLNLLGMAKSIAEIASRARNKQLLPDDVVGGTFTITNPGGYGTFHGTPVISQPQAAILGTYAIVKRPWVITDENGTDAIAIRSMMNLTLTYDHRLVDGALAGRFLRDLRERLQSWGESDYSA